MSSSTFNDSFTPLSFDVIEDAPDFYNSFQNIGQVSKQDYLDSWAEQAYDTIYGDPIVLNKSIVARHVRSREETRRLKQILVVLVQGADLTEPQREEYIDLYEGRVLSKPLLRRVVDALLHRFRSPGHSLEETLYKAAETVAALQYVTHEREELEEAEETDASSVDASDPRAPEFQTFRKEYPDISPLKAYSLGLENLTDEEIETAFGLSRKGLKDRLSFNFETPKQERPDEKLHEKLQQNRQDGAGLFNDIDWGAESGHLTTRVWLVDDKTLPWENTEDYDYSQETSEPDEVSLRERPEDSEEARSEEEPSQFDVAENPFKDIGNWYQEDCQKMPPATLKYDYTKYEHTTIEWDVYALPFDRTDPEKLAEYVAHLLTELMHGTLVEDESDTLPVELDLLISQGLMTAARGMAELTEDDKHLKVVHDAVIDGYEAGQKACALLLGYLTLHNQQSGKDWQLSDLIYHGMCHSEGWEETAERTPKGTAE